MRKFLQTVGAVVLGAVLGGALLVAVFDPERVYDLYATGLVGRYRAVHAVRGLEDAKLEHELSKIEGAVIRLAAKLCLTQAPADWQDDAGAIAEAGLCVQRRFPEMSYAEARAVLMNVVELP